MRCPEEFYLEILKGNLLSCYQDGTFTSGSRYADLGGDADVDAALVQHPFNKAVVDWATITGPRFRSSMALHYRP